MRKKCSLKWDHRRHDHHRLGLSLDEHAEGNHQFNLLGQCLPGGLCCEKFVNLGF